MASKKAHTKMKLTFTAACGLAMTAASWGQSVPMATVSPRESPGPSIPPSLREELPAAPSVTMPALDVKGIRVKAESSHRKGAPPPIGQHRDLPPDTTGNGTWSRTSGGRAVWRLQIVEPQAIGLRLHFHNFHVGAGRV